MGTVAAVGVIEIGHAVITVLNYIAFAVGALSLLCLASAVAVLVTAAAGNMRLARRWKRLPEPELGDDVLDTIARWHQAEFDEGLERLHTEEEKRRD